VDNFLKIATNRNSLKALIKNFYMDELEKLQSNLTIIIKQREEHEENLKKKNKKKMQKIEEAKSFLLEQGLTVDDLTGDSLCGITKHVKFKKKILPKYRLIDLNNVAHEWTGRGIAPKVFQEYFDRGHKKEDCLIIKNIDL
jgi:DNA-binding protein H-NS